MSETSIWGGDNPSVAWNENSWQSNTLTIEVTGVSATSSVGDLKSFNVEGWGRQEYGNSAWGVEYSVKPTGVSATTSVGTPTAAEFLTVELTGVSATSSVGELSPADVVGVSGQSMTSTLGSLTNVGTLVGWGRNGWGEEPYGDSINKVIVPVIGDQMATSVGSLSPADVMGLTGQAATVSVAELGTSDKFGIQAYQPIDTGSNTSYTDVAA